MRKLFFTLLFAASLIFVAQSAVIGIDFGSDFFKISLIMPGKSFVIVQNATSKRKTNNAIAFLGQERIYESDALNKRQKNPFNTFVFLNKFLGALKEDREVFEVARKFYQEYQIQFNEKYGTVEFKLDSNYAPFQNESDNENIVVKVEEVVGMLFRYAKSISERQAAGSVKDCVVTVPNFYTLNQRRMLNQAIKISGLTALSFVNENTAAAVYYTINRGEQNQTHSVIFYNIGSTGIQATLVDYAMTNFTSRTTNKKIPSISILADAGINNLGSAELDHVLAMHFAEEIDALPARKGKPSIQANRRAMVKLLQECIRLKETLSANKEAQFFVEGLVDGSDFKSKIDRATFEKKGDYVISQLTKPIQKILALANKTISDIDVIELIGGGVRIPKIIDTIQKFAGDVLVGQHLNGDECFALGAGFIAANHSHGFRVRDIHLNDGYNFDINLIVRNGEEVAEDHPDFYNQSIVLFPRKRKFGSKRIINFNYAQNIRLELETVDDEGRVQRLSQYNLTNITNITDHLTNSNFTSPQIHVQFVLSPFDGVELELVQAWVNETQTVQVDVKQQQNDTTTDSKQIPKKDEEQSDSDDDDEQTEQQKQSEGEEEDGEFSSKYSSKQNQQRIIERVAPEETVEKKIRQQIIEHFYNIQVDSWSSILPYFNETELAASQQIIRNMEEIEDKLRKLAEAKNRLESFIYQMKDIVADSEFERCSTEKEREDVKYNTEQMDEWLNSDEGSDSSVDEYREKIRLLNNTAKPVLIRIEESKQRDSAVNQTSKNLDEFQQKYNQMKQTMTWLTEEQREPFEKLMSDTQTWFANVTTLQNTRAPNEDPLFTSTELFHKLEDIKSELIQIQHIKKPQAEKNETLTEEPVSGEEGELKEDNEDDSDKQTDQKPTQPTENVQTDNEEEPIPPYDENKIRTQDEDL